MRTLIFDLLHQRARSAGCAEEAWEIIGEFAAAEALLERIADRGVPPSWDVAGASYVAAAEALLSCLSARGEMYDDDDLDDDEFDDEIEFTASPSAFPGSN